jgi:hypothetical protein
VTSMLASFRSISQNTCSIQSPPSNPANMSVVSGVKGDTAQQARSLVRFSGAALVSPLPQSIHAPEIQIYLLAGGT